ncbi:hypothetical protein L7F22_069001 [Adiantum nelumboides]|nr:hypothetical protein [Adiantum nelumboides]
MPIITRNKAKGVDRADEISISMTQESGSSHGTNSIIEPSNITTLDLVPSSVVHTSDTPLVVTNEPLSDCFGSLVDSHILAGWIDSHIFPYSHLLSRIPLCRLLANPAIRTQDDCVAELTTSIVERGYQPKMARFIVIECFPGQSPVQFDRRGVCGRELHMLASFDDQILQISELKHMEEKMFVVWDGNHRLHGWREWAYHERLDEFSTPRVECTLVVLNPTEMAEFLLVLSMINKVTRVHVPHTTAHDIFMMQKLGLADPKSILDKFDDEDRAKAKRVLRGTAMNRSKWLRLPMALLSQLLWKEKIQNLPTRNTREYMDHEEDYKASYAMALKATESVFVRKGLEIAVIVNPDNGSNFFRLCISFPSWGERGCKMTTFRVSEIARAHITSQERWLGYILKVSRFPIPEHPSNAWVDSEREETGIYPKDWIDDLQGTDAWRDCPWFLDYADGKFPDIEEGAYHGENYVCISFTWMVAINKTYIGFFATHHKKVKGKGKSFSATINQPKDAHSPSIAKGRPPRTAKGRPSISKKRPRPAVSESSESLEEHFELLSREDAEDSRHADSEQQPDSRRSSPLGRLKSQDSRRSSPSRQSRSQSSRRSSPA